MAEYGMTTTDGLSVIQHNKHLLHSYSRFFFFMSAGAYSEHHHFSIKGFTTEWWITKYRHKNTFHSQAILKSIKDHLHIAPADWEYSHRLKVQIATMLRRVMAALTSSKSNLWSKLLCRTISAAAVKASMWKGGYWCRCFRVSLVCVFPLCVRKAGRILVCVSTTWSDTGQSWSEKFGIEESNDYLAQALRESIECCLSVSRLTTNKSKHSDTSSSQSFN